MENFNDETLKVLPPIAISATSFLGVLLNDWVYIATFLYIVINIGCLLYRTFKK